MLRSVAIGCLLVSVAVSALSQEVAFDSPKTDLPVELSGAFELRSLTPFSIDGAEVFSRIEVGGRGFEYHRANIDWGTDGRPQLKSHRFRNTALGTVMPGMGSYLSGRRLHGLCELGGLSYLAANTLLTSLEYDDLIVDHQNLLNRYEIMSDSPMRERLGVEIEMIAGRSDKLEEHHQLQSMVTGGFAVALIFEGWWLNSPLRATTRSDQIFLRVPRLSRAKAVCASILWPGMGQAYRRQARATFYSAVEIYLVQGLLDSYLRQRKHLSDRSILYTYLATDGLSPADSRELTRLDDLVSRADRDVNLYAGLAGGVWLISVLDALINHPSEGPSIRENQLTMAISPLGSPGLAWTRTF
ncbi:MAG: hypothetical protein GY835_04375 [bacterium]|nr:hypothetical protein [bacterium]